MAVTKHLSLWAVLPALLLGVSACVGDVEPEPSPPTHDGGRGEPGGVTRAIA